MLSNHSVSIIIVAANLNAIMMKEIAADNYILVMESVMITTILHPVVILMEEIAFLMDSAMTHQ